MSSRKIRMEPYVVMVNKILKLLSIIKNTNLHVKSTNLHENI
jgi:hypothetical protein